MRRAALAVAAALFAASPVRGHSLDEYLQATVLSVDGSQLAGELKLVPGAEVWPDVLAVIDGNRDGRLQGPEMQAYARAVLADLSLRVDGEPLPLRIRSIEFAPIESFAEGGGEIRLAFGAPLPAAAPQTLVFENRHRIAPPAYLANILTPTDRRLRIARQVRTADQSRFEVEFETSSAGRLPWPLVAGLALLLVVASGAAVMLRRRTRAARRAS